MFTEEEIALIHLHHTKGIGALQLRKIIDEQASAINACKELKIEGNPNLLKIFQKEQISLLTINNPLYPKVFLELKEPPYLLYKKGTLPTNINHGITIVGTRTATNYGKEQAFTFAKNLAANGLPIISGLARGIDTYAHRGALEGGQTIAIIGSGLCQLYPKENQALSNQILEKEGAILSEYPLFIPPTRYSFIQRNRLLAALGKACLLIESPLEGGSMVTMEMAQTLKRPLFALPSRVDMDSFKGNFLLLKERKAELVEGYEDILRSFGLLSQKKENKDFLDLNKDEQMLYTLMAGQEYFIDELVLLTQLPIMKLNTLLTSLKIKGAVKEFSGKIYKKIIV